MLEQRIHRTDASEIEDPPTDVRLRLVRGTAMTGEAEAIHLQGGAEYGTIRIYFQRQERTTLKGSPRRISRRPAHEILMRRARRFGLEAQRPEDCRRAAEPETSHPLSSVCVDISGSVKELRSFCEEYAELLRGRVMFYSELNGERSPFTESP